MAKVIDRNALGGLRGTATNEFGDTRTVVDGQSVRGTSVAGAGIDETLTDEDGFVDENEIAFSSASILQDPEARRAYDLLVSRGFTADDYHHADANTPARAPEKAPHIHKPNDITGTCKSCGMVIPDSIHPAYATPEVNNAREDARTFEGYGRSGDFRDGEERGLGRTANEPYRTVDTARSRRRDPQNPKNLLP